MLFGVGLDLNNSSEIKDSAKNSPKLAKGENMKQGELVIGRARPVTHN